jgi:hypothetical protein
MEGPVNVGPVHGVIPVEGIPNLARSVEVARLWVQDNGPGTFLINPFRLRDPEMFGMMITDCVRHAARAYASAYGLSEGEALDRIWTGVDNERDEPTTPLHTIQSSTRGLS